MFVKHGTSKINFLGMFQVFWGLGLDVGGMGRNGEAEMPRAEMVRPKWCDVERARKVGSRYFNCSRPNGDINNGNMSV